MKYLYKNTGVVVESSVERDPAIFMPYKEPEPAKEEKSQAKTPARKTATRAKKK